jgi:hypothetical protein
MRDIPSSCLVPTFYRIPAVIMLVFWVTPCALQFSANSQNAPVALITTPGSESALHVAITVPANGFDLSKSWSLKEAGGEDTIPLAASPAIDATGIPAASKRRLLGTIPSGTQRAERRFEIVETGPGKRAASHFTFEEINGPGAGKLGLSHNGRPVFVYNHGVMSKPGVPADRNRGTYIHPLFGLQGEILTDDFPEDHHHHRGLFWAWPHITVAGKTSSLWDLRGIEQRFERWLYREAGAAAAVLGVENGWYLGEKKILQERVWFTVYPAIAGEQPIDMLLVLIPIGQPVELVGAAGKSYGGLTLRFAPRERTIITTPLGNASNDLAMTRLAWADLSAQFAGAPGPSGAAIFISPDHPDYPPTWLTRHYGVLCVGWPGVRSATLQPGEPVSGRYRVWIHSGRADTERAQKAYRAYEQGLAVSWLSPE